MPGSRGQSLPKPRGVSVAVLPFQNLSGDPQQEYFADGMVEEIITTLVEEIITTLSRLAFMGRAWDRSGWLNRLQAAADGILAATVRMRT